MSISNCISSTANTIGNTAVRGGRTGICTQIQTGDEQMRLHTSAVGIACPTVGEVRDKCGARLRAWVVLSCRGSWWLGAPGELRCDHTKTYSSLGHFQASTCPWPTFCHSVPSLAAHAARQAGCAPVRLPRLPPHPLRRHPSLALLALPADMLLGAHPHSQVW